jgi:hypothetical protein
MAKLEVSLRQIYQAVGKTYLARPAPSWAVIDVFMGHDGLRYAKLLNQEDKSLTKTISVEALNDGRLFALKS